MVKAQMDGRSRYTIKPIEEQLSFDKVGRFSASPLLAVWAGQPSYILSGDSSSISGMSMVCL